MHLQNKPGAEDWEHAGSCFFIGGLRQGSGECLCYDSLYATTLSSSMLLAAILLSTTSLSKAVNGNTFTDANSATLGHAVAIVLILL